MSRILLIPGTHDNLAPHATNEWWAPGSENAALLRRAGHQAYSVAWGTRLDGWDGKNKKWETAGATLWDQALNGDSIIAFSHGGAVAAYAAKLGRRFGTVITLGTPPRTDVPFKVLRERCEKWVHFAGDYRDIWAVLGSAGDGTFNWFRRDMPHAHVNVQWRCNHTDLCEVKTWERNKLVGML